MVQETEIQSQVASCQTLKMVLDSSLLNTRQYKVRIKGKVVQSWERGVALPTPRCSNYWKGSRLEALDYGRQLYFYLLMLSSHTGNYLTVCKQIFEI